MHRTRCGLLFNATALSLGAAAAPNFFPCARLSTSANVRFVTGAEGECYKHIRRNRNFSVVENDIFLNKGDNHVFCTPSKGGKVHSSSLCCEKYSLIYKATRAIRSLLV